MVALWKQGRTQAEIATQFGVSRQRVQQVLKKAGCTGHMREPRRPRPQRKAPEIRAAATARRQEILSLRRLGHTGSEIASKVGVSVTYANRVSKQAGDSMQSGGRPNWPQDRAVRRKAGRAIDLHG